MQVNLTASQRLLTATIPFLKLGVDPCLIIVGTKNAPAPGRGMSCYSVRPFSWSLPPPSQPAGRQGSSHPARPHRCARARSLWRAGEHGTSGRCVRHRPVERGSPQDPRRRLQPYGRPVQAQKPPQGSKK
eukprot:749369-Hanusia_phi.AAC.5